MTGRFWITLYDHESVLMFGLKNCELCDNGVGESNERFGVGRRGGDSSVNIAQFKVQDLMRGTMVYLCDDCKDRVVGVGV
jgi:hypothetical protein